jgi:hypothetical protein
MTKPANLLEEATPDTDFDAEITDDDFGIIIGPDGELKSFFLPNKDDVDIPENLIQILELLGVDVDDIEEPTLH